MNSLEICIILLTLSATFALISLGITLLKSIQMFKDISDLSRHLDTTVDKVNQTVDDVNYKLEKLNAPVEIIHKFFTKKRSNDGIFGSTLGLIRSILKK